ncbi:UDP-N-acetylmuramoylalanine--D-glutamate ligase [Evansella vedderi]|uniref:UDP-N-acetylmuramoylalanine--D-glutamate ligase n=1 Tax=Evansella vedderi TaxID=38282 RepID=A0ABT9ZRF9_9BACI|nr:UDP-N-acetylmuramoyl-L-alanine--D-glutamate ligase [Evansella vedderi]MDQ0253818.1 UDP-N-acetylmuramoylalanine--D-glutamate ligase [Evansella vedderi]
MRKTTQFKDKNILVLGLAKSGTAAAQLLLQLGAKVTVNDQKPLEENKEAQKLQQLGAEVICGSHPLELVHDQLDYVVKNPGIRYDNPLIEKAIEKNISVITEVELAYEISEADIIGITGSNGKTTTTTYIYEMLKGSSKDPLIAGNIGKVATEVAQRASTNNVLVTELSSFQLMGIEHFRPRISLLLNLVEAHIDYHGSMENYIQAKGNIFRNQSPEDYIIYNADDERVCKLVKGGQAKLIPFSTEVYDETGAGIKDNYLMIFKEKLIPIEEMSLPGEHNVANGLAAAAAAYLAGAHIQRIREVLKTFTGVEHRLQFVTNVGGRSFYNNSKATNVPATITSLKAFDQPVVLIAGGLDRGISFDDLIPYFKDKVKSVITYGETAAKIAETAKRATVPTVEVVETLDDAVTMAYENSTSGDVILLSPACASWDQFKTFEERGNCFVEAVKKIVP